MTHPLRTLRAAQGLSQESLSERSGVSTEHISRIETGKATNVRPSTWTALASALGVTRDELRRHPFAGLSWRCDYCGRTALHEIHLMALGVDRKEIER